MEGERLLQCIKNGTDIGSLIRDLEVYLAPLLHLKTSPSQELATKYGLYSMKVLRACVQQLTTLKNGQHGVMGIICIANKSYECICKAMKHAKMVPLSLEKLLFHMVAQSMARGLVADAMVFARNLHEHLRLCRHDFISRDGIDNEYDTVCKQAFNQLWKACIDLEHSSKQGTRKHMVVLDIRLQALTFLVLSSYEVSWVVERALRAVVEFDRASSSCQDENSQVFEFLRSLLDTLHTDMGETKEGIEPEEVSDLLFPLFELSLLFTKRCCPVDKLEVALSYYEKLQKLIKNNCGRNSEELYNAAVNITAATLHMRKLSPSSSNVLKGTKKSKSHKAVNAVEIVEEKIQSAVSHASKAVEKGDPNLTAMQCLVEALEFFKKQFDYIAHRPQDKSPHPTVITIPDELVQSVHVDAAFNLLIDLLQLQRENLQITSSTGKEPSASKGKQQRMSLQKTVNRQLAVLNLMSAVVLHRMNHTKEETSSDDIKKMTEDALSVCQRTQCIIEEVSSGSGGAVSINERRWLGTNAYNLGLMCYRKKWYLESVPLLSIACKQLQTWCASKELLDEEKLSKVQLLSKCELLVDSQRKANLHQEAMHTAVTYLWAHAGHLTSQLTTDQLTTLVELWIKAKRDAVKNTEDEQLRTRTLFDAVQEIEGTISDENASLASKLLEQELSIYKTQRCDTTVEQYAVVCDLLSLYSDEKMRLHRAHAHIEQAQLLRDGTLETDCSPVDCCREAIHLLEDLAKDLTQDQQQQQSGQEKSCSKYLVVFDLLATAYFWLYICESEANQATYITSQFVESKEESTLPESQDAQTAKKEAKPSANPTSMSYTLAAEYAATEPLDKALDIWADLMADGCNQSMFNDPTSTCYCLKVAASLCELADRPIQQLQALNLLVLLSIASSTGEDAILAYCQIVQALCRLGAVPEAERLLTQASALMGEARADSEDGSGVEVALMITKCYVLLRAFKIREFEALLGKVLQIHSHKRRSRQTYLRNASIKHLQALYLLLPPSERSPDAPARGELDLVDLSPLELRADAMRLQMGVGRLVFGEGVLSNEQSLQGDGFKLAAVGSDSGWNDIEFNQWTLMASVLESLYDVGSLYLEQGCSREAKSYLKEGLLLAEKFMLPRRCVAFLLQLSNLHAQCGQEDDCQASLFKVHQMLHAPKKALTTISQDTESPHSSKVYVEIDDTDDDFIKTRRISISTESSSRTRLLTDTTSSPALRTQAVKLPTYHTHPSDCLCVSCTDVSLHAQEIKSFLRMAQCLELQGELGQALTNLQAALNTGEWGTKKIPSLLPKSCPSLQNCESTRTGKKRGKGVQTLDHKSNDLHITQCDFHAETITEIHFSTARLHLLSSDLTKAQEIIQRGLKLANHESVRKSWLQFYEILTSLEIEAGGAETVLKNLIGAAWDVQSSSKHGKDAPTREEDLVSQFDQLDLGKPSSKHQTRFQESVFSERVQRPEVSRKLSEKASELGIFCDSDNDDSDETPNVAASSTKCARKSQTVTKETPQNVTLSSKKGALVFSVRKKKPSKKIWEGDSTPQVNSASISAFDFDEPIPIKAKSGARGRTSKNTRTTGRQTSKIIEVDSDIDEVFEAELETTSSKTIGRSKRATTTKKSQKQVSVVIDSETTKCPLENDDIQEETGKPKPSRKSKSAADANKDSTVKPRRGRKPQIVDSEPPEPKVAVARPRRGRKPNVENLRSEAVNQLGSDIVMDLLSTSLELESPVKLRSQLLDTPIKNSLSPKLELNSSSLASSSSFAAQTHSSATDGACASLILDDLDEIEVPRAVCDSDSDDSKTTLTVRRKAARKPAASRRKTAKKCDPDAAAEVLRASKTAPDDETATTMTTKRSTVAVPDRAAGLGSSKLGTSLDSVISTLEQIKSQVCHLAPALLYRRVCQLLAICCGDRDPPKAAYYLSEATAVTLRHQKLSSLAKKIKKLKKEMDADSVQNLSDTLATMTLDNSSNGSKKHESNLRHLTRERTLFTFNKVSSQEACPDVVQQTLNALPEGWTVCIMSVVSSSASLADGLSDANTLLLCRLTGGCRPVIVNHDMCAASVASSATNLLEEFDSILTDSKLSVRETDKRTWWTCRQQLDQRMQALTETMEETFLGPWKGMLLGARSSKEERQSLALAAEKLKTLLEAACQRQVDAQLCQCILESYHQLSRPQLSSALTSLTGLSPGSDQHGSLVLSFKQLAKDCVQTLNREPVILILDKQIQQLPWENTPILRDSPVCRMPSLYFVLSQLRARSCPTSALAQGLEPLDTFFILNPSNDLANTQKTFQKWFEKENGWKGVVARPPTKEEYKSALTDHQLFVFCGHGNGREFLTGDDVQRLTCRATSLLIGCSSGRLHVTGAQEASGMVLNYLVAECPCIVANLWDVTDRDIDRFLEHLLRSWLERKADSHNRRRSLLDCMAEARQACKLQYLIGCSPVVYGLPVYLQEKVGGV